MYSTVLNNRLVGLIVLQGIYQCKSRLPLVAKAARLSDCHCRKNHKDRGTINKTRKEHEFSWGKIYKQTLIVLLENRTYLTKIFDFLLSEADRI